MSLVLPNENGRISVGWPGQMSQHSHFTQYARQGHALSDESALLSYSVCKARTSPSNLQLPCLYRPNPSYSSKFPNTTSNSLPSSNAERIYEGGSKSLCPYFVFSQITAANAKSKYPFPALELSWTSLALCAGSSVARCCCQLKMAVVLHTSSACGQVTCGNQNCQQALVISLRESGPPTIQSGPRP